MPLMRRVATLGAVVAAARRYARQNPDKVNRYADQAATFVDRKTQGKYRKHIDSALRQVRKETSVPGPGGRSGASYRGPAYDGPGHPGHPGQAGGTANDARSYPSYREDRPR